MKKLWVGAVLAATAMSMHAYADTVTSVNVVGYVNLTVYGGSNDTYTLIAAPMTKVPVARGTITANTTTTITDSSAAWAVNAFAVGGVAAGETGSSTYYVEVTSGTFEGRHFYISANTATELTLDTALTDINAGDLNNATYKIIPANRIRDIFGEPGGTTQWKVGASAAVSDTVSEMGSSGWGAPVYYRNITSFPASMRTNWVSGTNIANNYVVDRDKGVLVLRRAGGADVELTVVGEVSANTQATLVTPGYSLIGGMNAVAMPIGSTTLTNVFAAGASAATADTISSWVNNSWSSPVYFKNNTSFPTNLRNKWVQGTNDVSSSYIIEPGVAYLVKKTGVVTKIWESSSPLE